LQTPSRNKVARDVEIVGNRSGGSERHARDGRIGGPCVRPSRRHSKLAKDREHDGRVLGEHGDVTLPGTTAKYYGIHGDVEGRVTP
jgi:hypothetical protein